MRGSRLLAITLAITLAACTAQDPDAVEAPPSSALTAASAAAGASVAPVATATTRIRRAAGLDYIFYPDEPMLPAFRRQLGPPPLKADQNDDVRYAAPQNYAITEPPPAGVRAMVEWEPMKAIVMQFPAYMGQYANVTGTFLGIARESAKVAEVWFIVDGQAAIDFLSGRLLEEGMTQETLDSQVKFLIQPIDSIWLIDSGPLPLVDEATGTMAFSDFRYYHERPLDDGISTWLGRSLPELGLEAAAPTYRMPLNVEGGTFQATTDGICITGNRQLYYMSCDQGACDSNIRYTELADVQTHPLAEEMRQIWATYAGCKDLIITNSITDDGTGHIDMYLKIASDDTIVVGDYAPPHANQAQVQNAARMDANAAFLEAYVKPDGSSFTVERVVMPGHRSTNQGAVPFTYINSTFINGVNLWPAFTYEEWVESRDQAEAEWQAILPDYEHVWIDSQELSFWSGAIHCVTRTIPDQAPGLWVADGTCTDGACVPPEGGYSGECSPNGISDTVCYGPEWLCTCNDCDTGCTYEPGSTTDECGDITYTGCCDGAVLTYCDGGSLSTGSCQGGCGWDAQSEWYDCGFTEEDPSGANPRACDALACEPDCTDTACGDDGCGGSCGECGAAQVCEEGACVATCTDACVADETGCDGETAWLCAEDATSGCTERYATDCALKGEICKSGLCVAAPAEPAEDTAGGTDAGPTTSDDISITSDAGPLPGAELPDAAAPITGGGGGGGGGCHAGGDTGAGGLVAGLGLLLLGLRRRRRPLA